MKFLKLFTDCVIVVETPPIKSRINEFAFTKAYMPPTYINLLNKSVLEKSTENIKSKIIETIIWRKRRENKFLSHALKNQLVFESIKDRKAKGVIKTNTLIKIYLKE